MARPGPPTVRIKYPHLLPGDAELWTSFLEKRPDFIADVEYDVHLGPGIVVPPDTPEKYRALGKQLTQYRVDVVAKGPLEIYVIEIKPAAGITAFGQALAYAYLYDLEFKPVVPVVPVILTNQLKPGMMPLYQSNHIDLWLMTPAGPIFPFHTH